MSIERWKFVEPPGPTKWASFHADKQDKSSSNDPSFNFENVSESLSPTSLARTFPRTNSLAEPTYTGLRYALRPSHLAFGKRLRFATLARSLGTGIMPAGHALFHLLPADAAHANGRSGVVVRMPPIEFGELLKGRLPLERLRFSVAAPLHLMSGWTGFKGRLRQMWAFRAAILELGQWNLLAMHVGRTWDCIGPIVAFVTAAIGGLRRIASVPERMIRTTRCCSLKRPRCCMLHEIFAGMASLQCFGRRRLDASAVAPIARFSFRKTPKHYGKSDA